MSRQQRHPPTIPRALEQHRLSSLLLVGLQDALITDLAYKYINI